MKRNIRRGPYSGPSNLSFASDMQILILVYQIRQLRNLRKTLAQVGFEPTLTTSQRSLLSTMNSALDRSAIVPSERMQTYEQCFS